MLTAEHSEALTALDARVALLEELSILFEQGQITGEELGKAIAEAERATLADQDLLFEIYAAYLGPFNLEKYGEAQEILAKKLEGVATLRKLYEEEAIPFELYASAFATVKAEWGALAPWREHLRNEIESSPEWIEGERKEALRRAGIRPPTEKRKTKKKTTEELRRRLWERLAVLPKREDGNES